MRAILMFWLLMAPAAAQIGENALMDRINAIDPATITEGDCDAQIQAANNLNGPDLLVGSTICSAAGKPVEGSFLLNAGQTRSIADLALMVPATRADSDVQTELYGFIYFYAGGPGSDEVLREPALRDRFFQLLDSWSPYYAADYDPGWNNRREPDAQAYASAIQEARAGRRQQLAEIARLFSDDTYYALHRRFQELQADNASTYTEGTPQAEMSLDLQRRMAERARELGSDFHRPREELTNPTDPQMEELSSRFPPPAPSADEVAQTDSDDATVQHCVNIAERRTIADETRVVRVQITRSEQWGTIWRADIEGDEHGPERFTCTERTSSSRPIEMGDMSVAPLPEGGPLPPF